MNFRPALAALSLTLALGACGELPFGQSETAPEATGHSGPPTVSPVDQPIETGGEGMAVSTAEASTMNTAIFRAVGTEPFWAVTAGSDTAVYERPGQRSVGVSVRRITYGRGVEFIGVMNGRPFTLNLQAATCSDGMSDSKYPFTARLSAGGQRLTGCAGPTDTMPKAQVRARSAAPATTPRRATPAPAPESNTTTTPASSAAESTTGESTTGAGTTTEATTNPSSTTTPSSSSSTSPSTNSGTTSGSTTPETTTTPSGGATTGAGADTTAPESGATQGSTTSTGTSTGTTTTGAGSDSGATTQGTGTAQPGGGSDSEAASGSTSETTVIPPTSEDAAD